MGNVKISITSIWVECGIFTLWHFILFIQEETKHLWECSKHGLKCMAAWRRVLEDKITLNNDFYFLQTSLNLNFMYTVKRKFRFMQILITSLNIFKYKHVQVQCCSCSFPEKFYSMRIPMIEKELVSYIIAAKIVRISNNYI